MSLIEHFHFLRPWFLILLAIPFLAYRYFFSGMKNVSAWETVCDKKLLDFLLIRGSSKQRSFVGYLFIIGLCGAILALAGPTWRKKNVPTFAPVNPVMLLLNLSSDMDNDDITPNRLTRAKFAIDDILQKLNGQVGLIVYTDEPYLISPITEDKNIISNLLPAINSDIMPENGDKLDRAINLAAERLKDGGYHQGSIIILTADAGQEFNAALAAAAESAASGYNVYIVETRADNNEKLQLLATKGNGKAVLLADGVDNLIERINSQISSDMQKTANEREAWADDGYYLLIIPLFCCLYFFRRGILIVIFCLVSISQAEAGFFTNSNQDGAAAFAAGDYNTAANSFEHPQWKASALYRQGDYANALRFFQKGNSVEDLYNQGNALAKSGKIDDAIAKYEEVLQANPQHEDAKFNLEYLKQQQNQQQQQNSKDQQDNSQSDNQNQSSDSQTPQSDINNNQSETPETDNNQKNQAQPEQGDDNHDSTEQSSQNSDSNTPENQADNNSGQSQQNASDNNENEAQSESEQNVPTGSEPDTPSSGDAMASGGQSKDDIGEFDEQTQAHEMSYRNIPEDVGGLLRAFIYKEYNKNRYGDK